MLLLSHKTKQDLLKKIFLKKNSDTNNFQITYAQTGILEIRNNRKILVLYDGETFKNAKGKISKFKFAKTDYNIANLNSKSTTSQKTQENSTEELIECLFILQKKIKLEKDLNITYGFDNCRLANLENIYETLYGRLIKPFYNIVLVMIALLLILKSKDDHTFINYKFKIFAFGFLFIIFLETSAKFIGVNLLHNIFVSVLPILLSFLMYVYFWTKLKVEKR